MGRLDIIVAILSLAGILYLFLSIETTSPRGASPYPYGAAACGLLWLPGLLLLIARVARLPPFRGEIL